MISKLLKSLKGIFEMATVSPGQLPHSLIKSVSVQLLTKLKKLEGDPAVPAELSSIKDIVNSLVDWAESTEAKIKSLPILLAYINADGTIASTIGSGAVVAVDASIVGAYAITFNTAYTIGHAFANSYAGGDTYAQAVSIDAPNQGVVVNVRTAGALAQHPFSIAIYRSI